MPNLKTYLNRRLSILEVAFVLALVAALAGAGFWIYLLVAAKILEARVNAAIPRVRADIRNERQQLVDAIEAYKARYGFYPRDHVISRQPLAVDAVTNWLVYELAGVIYNPTNNCYQLGGMETADAAFVKHFFHCDGFTNSGTSANQLVHFLPRPPSLKVPLSQFHDDPDVYVLGFSTFYDDLGWQIALEINVSHWRYVSSSPTNNPGKFDLWIEVKTRHQNMTIGNWKSAE